MTSRIRFGALLSAIYLLAAVSAATAQDSYDSFTDQATGKVIFLKKGQPSPAKIPVASALPGTGRGVPTSTAAISSSASRSKANGFVATEGRLFGFGSPLRHLSFKSVKKDDLGMSHVRYEQKIKEMPVFGTSVAVHLNSSGEVESSSAEVMPKLVMRNRMGVTSKVATRKAIAAFKKGFPAASPSVSTLRQMIFAPGLISQPGSTDGYYSWKVDLHNPKSGAEETYFIDARTSKLLFHLTGERYATTRQVYDCSTGTCLLDSYNSTYNYYFGRSEGQPARGPNPLNLPVIPTPVKVDVDHAYDIFGTIDEFTNTVIGINGANRHGGLASNLTAVTAATSFDTDSHCSNYNFGQYSGGQVRMCINSSYSDMAAHEYGHGISSYAAAPLNYYGEPGTHSEAFSDINAESLQGWMYATTPPPGDQQPWVKLGDDADWAMGRWEDIVTWNRMPIFPDGMQENYVTSCSTSNYLPYPDRTRTTNFYCGSSDLGGLHHNATVIGKAASMLAMNNSPYGYTVFNDCKIASIGYDKVIKIWFRATDLYYSASETFAGSYNKLIQACGDLYGSGSETCIQVTRALQATEMDQGTRCGTPPAWRAPYCRDSHPLCVDSDNGIMPFKALGTSATDADTVTVTGDPVPTLRDYTFTRKTLVEYNCNLNARDKRTVPCTWGGQDGRCLARSQNLC